MKRIHIFSVFFFLSIFTVSADEQFRLVYPNTDVHEIIALYQRLISKRIIYDNMVQGPINLVVDTPTPRGKAIELIERTLFASGFSLVDISSDSIQVVGLGRNPRSVGVPTYSKPSDIPTGERVITYIFKLQHRDATDVQQLLAQYIAPNSYTAVIADSKSETVIVSERTSVIQSLLPILAAFDMPIEQNK